MLHDREEMRIKRGHVALMKHPETALYSGVMLMGVSEVVDADFTAYTDGINKRYSRKFLKTVKSDPQIRGLILHENLHVALKQVAHGKVMFQENARMANMAADFVVNDIIENIKGTIAGGNERIVELPDGALYDPMFHNWSMREVYTYLKKHAKPKPKRGSGGQPCNNPSAQSNDPSEGGNEDMEVEVNGKTYDLSNQDEHDFEKALGMSPEEVKKTMDGIEKALREGGILAGRMGAKMPRSIADLLEPKIDWRDALRDFVSSTVKGKDEYTWRRPNKRYLANDMYLPSVENETIGEVVVAIDTSGSIGTAELTEFATELASIVDLVSPNSVRVLWWDTEVHGEQVFKPEHYGQIASLLKPLGGGGTHVGCVSKHIIKERITADCVIVFTDGYVESNPVWNIDPPTLWMITQNKEFEVPCGKKVVFNRD